MPRGGMQRLAMVALREWRAITFRQWAWTTAISLVFFVAHVVGVLPGVLGLVGPPRAVWSVPKTVGLAVVYIGAGYCFLIAVRVAEAGTWHRLPPVRRYVAAGLAACVAASLLQILIYLLVPSIGPQPVGWNLALDARQLLGWFLWFVANLGLSGGLALAVYMRFRSARVAREAFNAAAMDRVNASRKVLASRLAAMQAQVEPRFLLGTLAQVEAMYERDPQAGDRMLDGLIAYLRAALPQLRSERSTLKQEVQLAESYLRIMQIRMGSRLELRIDVHPNLDDCNFPPMMLLPLVEDALRNGLEPLPHGGMIVITADVDRDRLRVRVADDGLPRMLCSEDCSAITTLQERLQGLYGSAGRLEVSAHLPQGVVANVEVPRESARNHR